MQAEEKNRDFDLSIPDHDVMLSADKLKLQRVISNLLDNAMKFTPEKGRVVLSLEEEPDAVVMRVSVTGVGISVADKKHIFERFFRADESRTRPGNGLGLSMVHAILLAHGASIEVSDTEGGGTTFGSRMNAPIGSPATPPPPTEADFNPFGGGGSDGSVPF